MGQPGRGWQTGMNDVIEETLMSEWNLGAGLEDRGVIVTGAASGIGRATVQGMAAAGARVAAVDLNEEGAAATVAGLADPDRHVAIGYDLRDIAGLPGLVERARLALGDLWALAHVAAVLKRQPLAEVTEDDWDLQLDVNLKASFFLDRAAGDAMVAAGRGGRIINFTSGAWLTGPASGSHAYVASKGGVVSMARGMAKHYGPHGILVNTVSPGQIDTPMQHVDNPPEVVDAAIAACPLRRMGQPEELAAVVVFLASRHASFVNGATINVSGGSIMY
jgi:NAD(P)-dependent dehydrogenase (short-subunit alcohol dehydrogenase family)